MLTDDQLEELAKYGSLSGEGSFEQLNARMLAEMLLYMRRHELAEGRKPVT